MPATRDQQKTHFGYKQVPLEEKVNLVKEVFHSVAPKYDLMNDIMSLGLHRLWKRFTINQAALIPGQSVLDVATGTGDLAKAYAAIVGQSGKVIMTDINESMLEIGRDRLINAGFVANIDYILADAEHLPFADHSFDFISIAFGLRNITNKANALRSMYRVLKPGGKLLILEFSKPPSSFINKCYDWYSFHLIPKIGDIVTHDKKSYEYLVESIRMHPDQETLKQMMLDVGFEDVNYFNLSAGIVALHKGYKY